MSTEPVHPRLRPCPLPLPITKSTFDDIVATLRHVVTQHYTTEREAFMDKTLGNTHDERKKRSTAEVDKDFAKLKKADPVLASADPFKAAWLPSQGDIPAFPPKEYHAALTQGAHPLTPKEGLMLDQFVLENDRLLAMTVEEMKSVPYIDAWLFRFAVNRYFDFESAAPRFLKMRRVIHKYNLSFKYEKETLAGCFNGRMTPCPMWAHNVVQVDQPPKKMSAEEIAASDAAVMAANEKTASKKKVSVAELKSDDIVRPIHPRNPISLMIPRYMDWTKTTIEKMCKWEFFYAMCICSTDYFAQTHGMTFIGSSLDATGANFSKDLFNLVAEIMSQCLPVKMSNLYICNEGWFFTMVIAPLVKLTLSKKMRKKLCVISDNKNFKEMSHVPKPRRFPEMGGTLTLQPGEESIPVALGFVEGLVAHAAVQAKPSE